MFIATWEEYILALTLTAGERGEDGAHRADVLLPVPPDRLRGLMAASVVSTLPVVIALAFSGRFIIRGMASGGIRG